MTAPPPAPARELAGGGDVGLVLVDAAPQHLLAPLHEPSDAHGACLLAAGVGCLALGQVLRMRSWRLCSATRPRREPSSGACCRRPGDARLASRSPRWSARRVSPSQAANDLAFTRPGELAGLEHDVGGRHGVDALQAAQSTLFFHRGLDASLPRPASPASSCPPSPV